MYKYFVGKKSNPTFLVEVDKKISIYKPDKYSKNENFYEKYSLGELVLETKYDEIFVNPVSFKKFLFAPEMIVKIKKKYLIISTNIKEI